MGAITGTLALGTEMCGTYKLVTVTATIAATSDTITLTAATHGITAITAVVGAVITGGMDADFQALQVSFSGLVLTVVSKQADGAASDEFTGTTVSITVIGTV
ncbi:MAG: hypothetical protein WC373_00755 [Smithella sp.]|jgi:hypothetical protein